MAQNQSIATRWTYAGLYFFVFIRNCRFYIDNMLTIGNLFIFFYFLNLLRDIIHTRHRQFYITIAFYFTNNMRNIHNGIWQFTKQ